MTYSYKTFNYLPDFRCLGSDCEDTCCKDWDIWFDQEHFQKLKDTVENSTGNLHSKVSRHIIVNDKESATMQNYASLVLKKDGSCPFLLKNGWCDIHQQFGQDPLSNICAYFPRVLSRIGNTVELSGALSCPEMVRKCLFGTDSIELEEFDPQILPRPDDYPLTRELDLPADHFYYDNFLRVRSALVKLSNLEGFALDSRLYFMASFANRIGLFYRLDAENDERLLENELKQALSITMLERMDDFVNKYVPAEPVAIIVAQAVLQLRVQQFPNEKYSNFIKDIFSSYEKILTTDQSNNVEGDVLPAEELWQCFQNQRLNIDKYFKDELETSFSRYLTNCLYREWFITMPDVFTYIHMLLIRLAILRFLVYSHPDIQKMAERIDSGNGSPTEEDISQLRAYLVDVVYRNARAIDHNTGFLQVVYDAIYEQQMMTYDFSLPFIKF